MGNDNIQLFEEQKIRTAWDEEIEDLFIANVGKYIFKYGKPGTVICRNVKACLSQ